MNRKKNILILLFIKSSILFYLYIYPQTVFFFLHFTIHINLPMLSRLFYNLVVTHVYETSPFWVM